jgi:hypothetical protein
MVTKLQNKIIPFFLKKSGSESGMVFKCKKIHRYSRLISYCVCLFFYMITIFFAIMLNSVNAPNIVKYFSIFSFLAISIILTIELHRYPKFNIYELEISSNALTIYVNIALGRVGIERIQLDIDKCQIKEIFERAHPQLLINDGFSTYRLHKKIFEDEAYQQIRNALIEDYPEIGSAPEYKWITKASILVGFFIFAMAHWHKPFNLLYMLLIFFPIISFTFLKLVMNKLKTYVDNRKTPNSIILGVLLAPCFCLSIRILNDWNIMKITWSDFWPPFYIFATIYLASLIIFIHGFKISDILTTFALFICFVYAFQATIALNCLIDSSLPAIFQTTVINKRVHSYKGGRTYYVTVSPCGPIENEAAVKVNKTVYQMFNPNDEVNIYIHKGFFKIPWYYIGLEERI